MGYGSYSHEAHEAITRSRTNVPREQVFKQQQCHPLMNPFGVKLRESRDSAAHPTSLSIAFALDVTGSMGKIPEFLARRELPTFMRALLDGGVRDPQVLFVAVGDANSDRAPLQVGQFESSEREMDQWLTWMFLEGGGGGQGSESYELALYWVARHTAIDCFEKRRKRGYLFMTGDENPYPLVSRAHVKKLTGDELEDDLKIAAVVDELQRRYEPFFLIPDQARRPKCERAWRDLLGDHVICMDDAEDTCRVAAGLVGLAEGACQDIDEIAKGLERGGTPPPRVNAVERALTPFAATLRRDGTPKPSLGDPELPAGDGSSGHQRTHPPR
jgi:hypothetical protein